MSGAEFHHIGLTVSDLDASLRFWRDGLGAEEIHRFDSDEPALGAVVGEPGAHVLGVRVALPGAPFALDLYCYLAPAAEAHVLRVAAVGSVHVAVACDALEELTERLLQHGGRLVGSQEVLGGKGCVYLRDPDGHVLELQDRVARA